MEGRKRLVYRLALVAVMIIIVAAAAIVSTAGRQDPSETDTAFFLREYQEQIGVFLPEENAPVRMIRVYVDTLPAADQLVLRGDGIPVPDEDKLLSLIEDLES